MRPPHNARISTFRRNSLCLSIGIIASFIGLSLSTSWALPGAESGAQSEDNEPLVQVVGDPTGEFDELTITDEESGHEVDDMGFRAYQGAPTVELSALSDEISGYLGDNEDTFASSAYLTDYSALEVYYKDGAGGDADPELQRIIDSSPAGKKVVLVPVTYSMAELDQAASEMAATLAETDGVDGVGPSAAFKNVVIDVSSAEATSESLEDIVTDGTVVLEETDSTEASITPLVRIEENQEATTEATRTNDTSPFYMGGRIKSGTARCSIGIPITIDGKFMVMTAGHCAAKTWKNENGNYLGDQYTTTYNSVQSKSTLAKYGDWKLLTGSHYSMRTFSSSVSSSTSQAIRKGTWDRRAEGAELCMSGGMSGTHCRLVVLDSRRSWSLDNLTAAYTTRVRYDPNRNGSYACGASQGGDSGGLYYYSDGAGGAVAYGIHRGKTVSGSKCIYHATEVAGVKAWKSSAKVN